MLEGKKIAVVVPAYNEEELILETLSSIPSFVDSIIVIDDSSLDTTVSKVEGFYDLRITLVRHPINSGVGRAIASGYKESLKQEIDITVVMGADAQMCSEDLMTVIDPVLNSKANYSKGNRFLCKDYISCMPVLRRVGNTIFSFMSRFASGYYHIFDSQCGFTAVDLASLSNLELEKLYPRYRFPTDMLAKLNMISAKVVDVPVKAVYNREKSGIKAIPYTFAIMFLTISLFFQRQIFKIKKGLLNQDRICFVVHYEVIDNEAVYSRA